ncbi:DUF1801 domain-containing protein [Pedobacter sp. MC2016-24]|uniref:DUF1801 domain-containing protein n=1 Tax=Pedobacter sp. MC2016-24 TaxID=2780090 RepID=UPI0018829BB1|nr:DUF1801 domain-containing protein [Pedobacter sp. MC2016-24]MBE9602516.1 DUF1801 domain-containing protein [Pedobacter sp. MC2016-24]
MKTDFVEIFQTIRAALQPYATLGFDNRINSEDTYDLWSNKNVEIEGKKRNEVYFAAVMIHKGHVGFYFMPVYAEPEMKKIFDPALLKLLKGKSCFHIKKLDDTLLSQIEEALANGFKLYKERGWV